MVCREVPNSIHGHKGTEAFGPKVVSAELRSLLCRSSFNRMEEERLEEVTKIAATFTQQAVKKQKTKRGQEKGCPYLR